MKRKGKKEHNAAMLASGENRRDMRLSSAFRACIKRQP